jgi:hypothetical protein
MAAFGQYRGGARPACKRAFAARLAVSSGSQPTG